MKSLTIFLFRIGLLGPALMAMILACSPDEEQSGPQTASLPPDVDIRVVSTRPHLVTGGDALLQLDVDRTIDESALNTLVNGEEVRSRFRRDSDGRLIGRLEELPGGESRIEVRIEGQSAASLDISNHPVSGPVISGPHEEPFLCQTAEFERFGEAVLGPAQDEDCFVPTRNDHVYYSEAQQDFRPYPSDGERPDDLAEVTTMSGETVPFIVLVQTGVVNRAIYEIAMLHDPAGPAPDPWNPGENWNRKLVYTHGGGCRSGWYQQGDRSGGVLREGLLGMGYALASSSLNVFGQNCNDLLASETHIMVKERFIEQFGEPLYTIATGVSGGSYQSHQTADNYPGVFDGLIVGLSFPDVTSSTIFTLADSRLLHHYFTQTDPEGFSLEEQRAISGFGVRESIPELSRGAARLDPIRSPDTPPEQQGGELSLPELEAMRYGPDNPDGVRATVYDHTVNVYGRDEETGFAERPLDNVGVQYGLQALNDGVISIEQFIALNRDIGGLDHDGGPVPERHRADPRATRNAIGSGRVLFGGAGLAETPIIDYRRYLDDVESGDIHMMVHQFATRQRLLAANGHADNHVMRVGGRWGFSEERPDLRNLFREMDRWLMAIREDDSGAGEAEKVVDNRPANLVDACWDNRGEERELVRQPQTYQGDNLCAELYPAFPTPRNVAGAPLANDTVACELRPLEASDYAVDMSAQQLERLREVFPEGVCDWSADGRYADGYFGTWLSFGPSPVNRVEQAGPE